ncbi:retrovirus-related Pol polyprotein from transposon 412 [Trichonephila clavipes]|nr:retrovirus-related Pol polyprotein from transposon 412 [Trichonephila clavipes]
MLLWCLNVFEKIVVRHLHISLKTHISRRRRLREFIRHKRPHFGQSDNSYVLNDNASAHRSQLTTSLSCHEVYPIFDQEANTVAEILVQHLDSRYGVPLQLHSDQGRTFDSAVCKRLCEILGINKTQTTILHPHFDGMVTRSAVHKDTGYSPSQMLFGRDLRLPADLLLFDVPLAPEEYVEKLQTRMEEMQHLIRDRIGMASEKMKTQYGARATRHDLHEGHKV